MMARIGVMKALNRLVERVFNSDRKDHHWGKRKLERSVMTLAKFLRHEPLSRFDGFLGLAQCPSKPALRCQASVWLGMPASGLSPVDIGASVERHFSSSIVTATSAFAESLTLLPSTPATKPLSMK